MTHASTASPVQSFDFAFHYEQQVIPCRAWLSPGTRSVAAVLFLGTVQIEKLGEWTAASCPPGTVVIQGAPHWFAKEDGSDIPAYMFAFTESAFAAVLMNFDIHKLHVLAESQAVPGVIRLLLQRRFRIHVKHSTFIQPLGLNASAYNQSDAQRVKTFIRRIIQNARYQLLAMLMDPRLRYNHHVLTHTINVRSPVTAAQYGSGLRYDAGPELRQLTYSHLPVRIISGGRDQLFRSAEIQATLNKLHIPIVVETVRGVPHSPLATQLGQRLLRTALSTPDPS